MKRRRNIDSPIVSNNRQTIMHITYFLKLHTKERLKGLKQLRFHSYENIITLGSGRERL